MATVNKQLKQGQGKEKSNASMRSVATLMPCPFSLTEVGMTKKERLKAERRERRLRVRQMKRVIATPFIERLWANSNAWEGR